MAGYPSGGGSAAGRTAGLVAAVLVMLFTILAPTPAGAGPAGDLDPTFGTGGIARITLDPATSVDVANSQASDNRDWLAAGSSNDRFALANLSRQGDFAGLNGEVVVDFGRPAVANAIVEHQGRVVAAGKAGDDFALAGFAHDELDFAFGRSGQVTTSFGAPAEAQGIVTTYEPAGYLAFGTIRRPTGADVAMAQYDFSGRLVAGFGTGGLLTDSIGSGDDVVTAVARTGDQRILVAGRAGPDVLVARYRSDGTRDPGFGNGGVQLLTLAPGPAIAEALSVDGSGRILVGGSAGGAGFVARLSPAGPPDPTFGTNGVVLRDGARFGGVTPADDTGGVRAAGSTTGPNGDDGLLVALNADGTPDPAFGAGGTVVVDLGGAADRLNAIDGINVVGGNGADMIAFLVGADGSLSRPFHEGGFSVVDFGERSPGAIEGIATQPDGKTVVAGSGSHGIYVARLRQDGTLDSNFGRAGVAVVPYQEPAGPVALQPDGKIVLAAGTGVVRFLANGALDGTYGTGGFGWAGVRVSSGSRAGIALMPDGGVVVTANADVARLTASGALVYPGYSQYCCRTDSFGVVAQPDGGAVALLGDPYASLTRRNGDGSRDPRFGGTFAGWPVHIRPGGLVRLAGGKIVLGGTDGLAGGSGGPTDLMLARYNPDGSQDLTFGGNGTRRVDVTPRDYMVDLLRQPDGKLVSLFVAGSDPGRPQLGLARILSDGRLDRSFGISGTRTFPGIHPSRAAMSADGSIMVAGWFQNGTGQEGGVTRFVPGSAGNRPVQAWGANAAGQLGTGATSAGPTVAPTPIGPRSVTAMAGGALHTLAVRADGTAVAWGANATGQLGDGSVRDSSVPRRVAGLSGVTSVAAGANHSLALTSDGTVWAWGWNRFGQLGNGSTADSAVPVRVAFLSGVVAVAAGTFHSLALKADGTVWAWGGNNVAQVGTRHPIAPYPFLTTDQLVPAKVCCDRAATAIAAGGYHSLVVTEGRVMTWGWDHFGQVAVTLNMDGEPIPNFVEGPTDVVAVAGGYLHSMALTADGKVWTWGFDGFGQLGSDQTRDGRRLVRLQGLPAVMAISAGMYHSAVFTGEGTVRTWGWNGFGQLGNGSTTDAHTPVTMNATTPPPVGITAGWLHTLSF